MNEIICSRCDNFLPYCTCSEEVKLRKYHKSRIETFGVENELIETMLCISMLNKRIEELEKQFKEEKKQ